MEGLTRWKFWGLKTSFSRDTRDKKVYVSNSISHLRLSCVKQSTGSIVEKIASAIFKSLAIFCEHSPISSILSLALSLFPYILQPLYMYAGQSKRYLTVVVVVGVVGTRTSPIKFKRSYSKLMRRLNSSDNPPSTTTAPSSSLLLHLL